MNNVLNGQWYRLGIAGFFLLLALVVGSCWKPAHAAPATPTAPTNEIFPENPLEAASMIGVAGTRSGDSAQWQMIDGGGVNFMFGDAALLRLSNCMYGRVYYDGANIDVHGQTEQMAETASLYRDWDTCPDPVTPTPTPTTTPEPTSTPTPYPDVPVGPALTSWPPTAADAAWAFSAAGMQTIVEKEVTPCGNGNDCWNLRFVSIRPVSVPKGAKGQTDQGMVSEVGLWVTEITIWRDWDVLPGEPVHPDRPISEWLLTWPQTAEAAAAVFSPSDGPALDPSTLTPCDGGGECWLVQLHDAAYVKLPNGALGQVSESVYKTAVETYVTQVTIRRDWEAKLPPVLYLPALFK